MLSHASAQVSRPHFSCRELSVASALPVRVEFGTPIVPVDNADLYASAYWTYLLTEEELRRELHHERELLELQPISQRPQR